MNNKKESMFSEKDINFKEIDIEKICLNLHKDSWNIEYEPDKKDIRDKNCGIRNICGGVEFYSIGIPSLTRRSKWSKSLFSLNLRGYKYVVIKYRAEGFAVSPWPVITISGQKANGEEINETLAIKYELIEDGYFHTMILKRDFDFQAKNLSIALESNNSKAIFAISNIEFISNSSDFPICLQPDPISSLSTEGFECVDLKMVYNGSYDSIIEKMLSRVDDNIINDAGKYFSNSKISIEGIPFIVKPGGNNIIIPPRLTPRNDDMIENYELIVKRRFVAPISRDDIIEVNVNDYVNEIFFLIVAEIPTKRKNYRIFLIEDMFCNFSINDIEEFSVELLYKDGTRDFAFPYSIEHKRHSIKGVLGAYVVSSKGKKIDKLIFHNRMIDNNIHIAAITFNKSKKRSYPQLIEEPETFQIKESCYKDIGNCLPYLNYTNDVVTLGNKYIEMQIVTKDGFYIRSIKNKFLEENIIRLSESPALKIKMDGKEIQKLELANVSEKKEGCNLGIDLNYKAQTSDIPMEFHIYLSVGEETEIIFKLNVVNNSNSKIDTEIVFPIINRLTIGSVDDMWYLYPQFRTALNKKPGIYYQLFSTLFPVQFYDIYNAKQGGGVYVMTREKEHVMRGYGLSKDYKGISCFVKYPDNYTHLAPNQIFTCSETRVGVHIGDWHIVSDTYIKWFKNWYKGYQNKQWFRESFSLLAGIVDFFDNDDIFYIPAWYDPVNKKYRIKKILEEYIQKSGRSPDILHFWHWSRVKGKSTVNGDDYDECFRWGEYGKEDYEQLGGLEIFKSEISDVQDYMGIPVSLYVNARLCSAGVPILNKLFPEKVSLSEDGSIKIPIKDTYQICHFTDEWIEYMVEVYKRLHRETGVKILYVDQVGTPEYEACYSKEHGHEVPCNMNKADSKFLKAIREAVSDDVVLYGESPNVDINTKLFDCNIHYYLSSIAEGLVPIYDHVDDENGVSEPILNIYKFLFPEVVQMTLPHGMQHISWHPMKFTFFNGDTIYNTFWVRLESKAEAFLRKAFEIKKKYADCFSTLVPQMLVPTEKCGIYANMFTGDGRTIWTIYNGQYNTVRSKVITIKHIKGAKYYDVWNDKLANVKISDGNAEVTMVLHPQETGCILQANEIGGDIYV